MSKKTIHEIHVEDDGRVAKCMFQPCRECGIKTLHITPFFGFPFQCVAWHGGSARCDGCGAFVEFIAKVVVTPDWNYKRFCELCCEADSPEKQQRLEDRKREAERELDPHNPEDRVMILARALGASSFSKKG
jgi:transcription elongation factor Elf1